MPQTVEERYAALVAAGEIERDPAQEALAAKLGSLATRLGRHRLARKSSSLGWLFGRSGNNGGAPKGLYIYGDVGRGKTMLMDMFWEASPVPAKRRTHFHEFMLDVHERVRAFRHKIKYGEIASGDPIQLTAAALTEEASLICFDEFQVTDIADAMILARLFTRLFEAGTVMVATSNVAPDDLYVGGLNRSLFLPFVGLLKQHVEMVELDARTDFRLEKLAGLSVWHTPADAAADAALDAAWHNLTGGQADGACELHVQGRVIRVPQAAMGVARFSFAELCEQPHAAADFLKIAREFHTILVDHIPIMDYGQRNAAKRFIILIDTLYDHAVKLIASAAAAPDALYRATEGFEAHEFRRTASRLFEMASRDYLALPHGRRAAATAVTAGIVDT
jgi:cell division protein ZapE